MSLGQIAFYHNSFSGLGVAYDMFPDRLFDVVLQKNASLYNELYDMLTDEEKDKFNAGIDSFIDNDDPLTQIEKKSQSLRKEIQTLKESPYNSHEARRERFREMPQLIEVSTKDFDTTIADKEEKLRNYMETIGELKKRQEQSIMFN